MFRVGQKVVCIEELRSDGLEQDRIYTVSAIKYGSFKAKGAPGFANRNADEVWLFETETNHGHGYYSTRFRPIVERKTDISVFTKMLLPASKERVDARP